MYSLSMHISIIVKYLKETNNHFNVTFLSASKHNNWNYKIHADSSRIRMEAKYLFSFPIPHRKLAPKVNI